jgi:hypothetical protein
MLEPLQGVECDLQLIRVSDLFQQFPEERVGNLGKGFLVGKAGEFFHVVRVSGYSSLIHLWQIIVASPRPQIQPSVPGRPSQSSR